MGPGTWDQLPGPFRAVLEANAPTYLDELADPTTGSIDAATLATTTVPVMLTRGTESPPLFGAVIAELVKLVPGARVEVLEGAGHIPHATHPDEWVARLPRVPRTVFSPYARAVCLTRPEPTRPAPTQGGFASARRLTIGR